ncbi:unknown [[Mannheimia] succiniciproducens MBEL55E]|uniref:Uncharacterized protein n=1 Tax=Mannheimia succiniciproducens (strain KCTC 0769BP / MBEL55E) TaxID=221988 RepID=Q65QA2_MANSM|nr:unknown [[Mannheimia] succiniciproducens MBEL55E]
MMKSAVKKTKFFNLACQHQLLNYIFGAIEWKPLSTAF